MRGSEVGEGGQGGDMCKELDSPELFNLPLDQWFPFSLRWWEAKHLKGIREVILVAEVAHLDEPGKG